MKIEILGSGCAKCRETERRVQQALAQSGKVADVEHLYDMKAIAQRGVMFTPAVAVDGQVRITGKVPAVEDIIKLLG
ncbi:MAG TPA: thioredoxin family protein [Burkholderiales bacterium]|nr:thioredoxin family protein [Burkholderiales bacterium]